MKITHYFLYSGFFFTIIIIIIFDLRTVPILKPSNYAYFKMRWSDNFVIMSLFVLVIVENTHRFLLVCNIINNNNDNRIITRINYATKSSLRSITAYCSTSAVTKNYIFIYDFICEFTGKRVQLYNNCFSYTCILYIICCAVAACI